MGAATPLTVADSFRMVRTLPAIVRTLVAGTFVNQLGTFVVPYLTLVLRRDFQLDEYGIGLLMLAFGLGSLVSVQTGGWLTDRLGRRLTLLVSLLGSGTLAVALGLVSTLKGFVPLLVLFGLVRDLYRPASSAIIADLLPSQQRAVGFGALRMAGNLGFAVGMMAGGVLAGWSWRLLFVGDGLTTLAFGIVVWRAIPETATALGHRSPDGEASPWRDRVFVQVLLVSFLWSLVFFCHLTELPLTMTLAAGYPPWLYGALVGLNGLGVALFEVAAMNRLRHRRRLRVAAVGTLLLGLCFASVAFALHWAWFLAVVIGYTVAEILTTPLKMSFVSDWAPPGSRGRYLAWHGATWNLAVALNPILFLPLRASLGDAGFWPLMLLILAPCALLLWRLDATADRPERLRGYAPGPPAAVAPV